jgi:hypothetical protein
MIKSIQPTLIEAWINGYKIKTTTNRALSPLSVFDGGFTSVTNISTHPSVKLTFVSPYDTYGHRNLLYHLLSRERNGQVY